MEKQIIILNGPSSSGKSTLARALQELIRSRRGERYEIVSIDDFLPMSAGEAIWEDDVYAISPALTEAARRALQSGGGVIVDHVITSKRILDRLTEAFPARSRKLIRVSCPREVLLAREAARGNRCPGSAAASADYLYPKDGYDLTVDTHAASAADCAERICRLVFREDPAGPLAGMDPFVNEEDFALLRGDRISFSVLESILRGPCAILRSDHRRLILCHSTPPFPVWIWTPEGLSAEEAKRAWRLTEELCPLSGGYRLMMKYELAEAFLELARQAGQTAGISRELLAYDCPAPLPPERRAEGSLHPCGPGDLEQAAALLTRFCAEIGEHPQPEQTVLEKCAQKIADGALFFWKDPAGRTAACCGWRHSADLATMTDVYTLPEFRRRHFAQTLIYELTRRAREAGFLPVLYTNANYPASNACYRQIGYRLRGRLCTVSLL